MSSLRDPQLELFARELVAALNAGLSPGKAAAKAAECAGYPQGRSRKTFEANCRKRAQRKDVQARVAELRAPGVAQAEKTLGITTEYLLEKLDGIVSYNVDDYLSEPDDDGERHYTLKDVPRELLGRLADAKIGRAFSGRGRKRRLLTYVNGIEGYDPIAAIKLMAQIKGLLAPDKIAHTDPDGNPVKVIHEVSWKQPAAPVAEPSTSSPA